MTPAVVSRPQPASATAYSATKVLPPPSRNAPKTRAADQDRRVDGRLEAERDAGQDDRGRAGERGVGDVLDRAADGVGEVAGHLLDQDGQHDADEHGDEGDDGRVAGGAAHVSR